MSGKCAQTKSFLLGLKIAVLWPGDRHRGDYQRRDARSGSVSPGCAQWSGEREREIASAAQHCGWLISQRHARFDCVWPAQGAVIWCEAGFVCVCVSVHVRLEDINIPVTFFVPAKRLPIS